ncbi:hypothetical protein ACIGJO_04570 [Streptomyces sp. NPDC079020]
MDVEAEYEFQVRDLTGLGTHLSVKYRETARGGLAVNIVEC